MDEEELSSKKFDPKLTMRLLGYLRPYGVWVGLTFALIFLATGIQQAGPYLSKIAVDDYILPGDAQGLGSITTLFIGLLILQFGLGYAQSWMTSMVGQWAMRDVRIALFSRLQRLPLGFFDRTPIGRLMARNTNDVDALNELFTNGVVSMLSELCTVLAILAYIFFMNVELGAITAGALPLVFAATLWLQSKTFKSFRAARIHLVSSVLRCRRRFRGWRWYSSSAAKNAVPVYSKKPTRPISKSACTVRSTTRSIFPLLSSAVRC